MNLWFEDRTSNSREIKRRGVEHTMRPIKVKDVSLGMFYYKTELVKKFRQNIVTTEQLRIQNVMRDSSHRYLA